MSNSSYRPDIDGLRAVAVLAVVIHHLSEKLLPGGYVGVDVFFVISGYLITRLVVREVDEGRFSFVRFYERRVRRLFPALFVVLVATLVVGWFVLLPSDYASTFRTALGTTLFSSNVVLWHEEREGYFALDAKLNPLLHTWSLAVEEQFYMVFPLFIVAAKRYSARYFWPLIIAVATVSFLASVFFLKSRSAVFFFSPFRAWELLAGGLLTLPSMPRMERRVVRDLVAAVGLTAILASSFLFDSRTVFPGFAVLIPVLGTMGVLHAGFSGPSFARSLLTLRPMVYVGLISYSLYLWHWPLIVLARFGTGMAPLEPYVPWLLAGSCALGAASYHLVEQPLRQMKPAATRQVFSTALACSMLLIVASVAGLYRHGFPARFLESDLAFDAVRKSTRPYQECDGRSVGAACALGAPDASPSVVLWGDSHMLAWGPAFDAALKARGLGADFLVQAACPPVNGARGARGQRCPITTLDVENLLAKRPLHSTVVLAARWGSHFTIGEESGHPVDLAGTVERLRSAGARVIVMGPVPTYDADVPSALALRGGVMGDLSTSKGEQHAHARLFFDAVSLIPTADFTLVDPIGWMCTDGCAVQAGGISHYRDDDHLSVSGALAFKAQIGEALDLALAGPTATTAPVAVDPG